MCLRAEEVLHEVIVILVGTTRLHSPDSLSTTTLQAIFAGGRPLHIATVAERADHAFIGDEILDRDLAFIRKDLALARIPELLLHHQELVLDDPKHPCLLGQDIHEVLDLLDDPVVVILDLFTFKRHQLIEA